MDKVRIFNNTLRATIENKIGTVVAASYCEDKVNFVGSSYMRGGKFA